MEPKEIFSQIYDILVQHAGASDDEDEKQSFIYAYLNGEKYYRCSEYRFCGMFGMAGKFWRYDNRYFISGYNLYELGEERYQKQQKIIDHVNDLLKQFPYWEPPKE